MRRCQAKTPYEKALNYLKKHDYLKLKCLKCRKTFTCSGHCLKLVGPTDTKGCLCEECDQARRSDPIWFGKCKKEFPEGWILKDGK